MEDFSIIVRGALKGGSMWEVKDSVLETRL